jgi:serine/threonine protein kinase
LKGLDEDCLNEVQAKEVMIAVTEAVLYCHKLGIVHRDIKLENLLLTDRDLSKAMLKLADFGLSCLLSEG